MKFPEAISAQNRRPSTVMTAWDDYGGNSPKDILTNCPDAVAGPLRNRQMRTAIFPCSLTPTSRSRILAEFARDYLLEQNVEVEYFNMCDHPLPDFCDMPGNDNPVVRSIVERLSKCQAIILAVPIYNWSPGSIVKKLMENTGNLDTGGKVWAWENKIVTFLRVGGLHHSYMAYGSTAMSLMMDFKSIINPHIVYAREVEISTDGVIEEPIRERARKVLDIHVELTELLKDRKLLTGWCI